MRSPGFSSEPRKPTLWRLGFTQARQWNCGGCQAANELAWQCKNALCYILVDRYSPGMSPNSFLVVWLCHCGDSQQPLRACPLLSYLPYAEGYIIMAFPKKGGWSYKHGDQLSPKNIKKKTRRNIGLKRCFGKRWISDMKTKVSNYGHFGECLNQVFIPVWFLIQC